MSLKRVFFLFLGSRFIEKNLFRKLNLNRSKGILKRGGGNHKKMGNCTYVLRLLFSSRGSVIVNRGLVMTKRGFLFVLMFHDDNRVSVITTADL